MEQSGPLGTSSCSASSVLRSAKLMVSTPGAACGRCSGRSRQQAGAEIPCQHVHLCEAVVGWQHCRKAAAGDMQWTVRSCAAARHSEHRLTWVACAGMPTPTLGVFKEKKVL